MHRIVFPLVASVAGSLLAQSNTVVGLDGRLDVVNNLTYWGRTAPAHPNAVIGMAMLNTMCNPGTVNIPWSAAMAANHPKFGFLITRVSGGRMVQISNRSFCKHAFTSTNGSGSCGSCINPGTGSLMGVHCSDTYGAGNNGDPNWLGPAEELDPWLGTWNPIGSYFDRGDPPVAGAAATDGVRSLDTSSFDQVKNRVNVKESDMLVAGASYFYGIHLMHQGEAAANRSDNLASRGFNPVYAGGTNGSWTLSNNAVGQVWGSILQHWTGATLNGARNGNDDGTFFVAVKVTALGGGQYHYEYAVHNADNNRGGAALHVPVDAAASVTNIGFRDIDSDALNEWTSARVGNELVFSASATNPLNWNTIYNFWFDCNLAPSPSAVIIDEARIGPGALSVPVVSQAPSGGLTLATVNSIGVPCGTSTCTSSLYEFFGGSPGAFDLANSGMTMTLSGSNYVVGTGTGTFVAPTGASLGLGDDQEVTMPVLFTLPFPGGTTTSLRVCSNGFISTASNGTTYNPSVGEFLGGAPRWAACWHDLIPNATNNVRVDSSATVLRVTWAGVPNYTGGGSNTFQVQFFPSGVVNIIWQAMSVLGNEYLVGWTPGGNAADPGSTNLSSSLATPTTLCSGVPYTGITLGASNRPVLGTSINLTTGNIPAGTSLGALVLSFVEAVPAQNLSGLGMTGCLGYPVGGVNFIYIAPVGSAVTPLSIPNVASYTGMSVVGQSFTFSSGFNPAGIIASNGLEMVLGPL